jgi:hypothetical protein
MHVVDIIVVSVVIAVIAALFSDAILYFCQVLELHLSMASPPAVVLHWATKKNGGKDCGKLRLFGEQTSGGERGASCSMMQRCKTVGTKCSHTTHWRHTDDISAVSECLGLLVDHTSERLQAMRMKLQTQVRQKRGML